MLGWSTFSTSQQGNAKEIGINSGRLDFWLACEDFFGSYVQTFLARVRRRFWLVCADFFGSCLQTFSSDSAIDLHYLCYLCFLVARKM